jgi:hypothetical protein
LFKLSCLKPESHYTANKKKAAESNEPVQLPYLQSENRMSNSA